MMTTKELAEKILKEHCTGIDTYEEALSSVVTLLETALREAVLEDRKATNKLIVSWQPLIEQAVLVERERCAEWMEAQAAADWNQYLEQNMGVRNLLSFEQWAAQAIRQPPEGK